MSFRSFFHRSQTQRNVRRANHGHAGRRPSFETLEDRCLLSTFTVLNLADSGADSLRSAILAAEGNPGPDIIDFAPAAQGTIALTSGQLSITDDLTIDGPGADLLAVSGNHQSRIFNISGGATVAIAGLTITDGRVAAGAPRDGGGILNTGSTLTLAHVVLSNNQAIGAPGGLGRGGAIANVSGATLTVTDCLFTQNQALGGAGGGTGNTGGIFNAASRVTVSRSAFIANQAIGGTGGGPALAGGINNTMGSTATITDSTFVGNQVIAGDGGSGVGFARGGGLFNFLSTMTVENCSILENVVRGGSGSTRPGPRVGLAAGGGIFSADTSTLFLTGTILKGNQVIGGSDNTSTSGNGWVGSALGGGLANAGTATLADCFFEGNEVRGGNGNRGDGIGYQFVGTGEGGGIATLAADPMGLPTILSLSNVTLRHNRAIGGDGNTAGAFVNAAIGGGLRSDGSNGNIPISGGSTTTLQDSTIAHNQAIGGSGGPALGGGAANTLGGVFTISGSTLIHNQALGSAGGNSFGGGLYNGAASDHPSNFGAPTVLTVMGSSVAHNAALGGDGGDGWGGGLYIGGTATILDTAISKNRAIGGAGGNGFGGGVFNDATASLRLERSTVTKNHANGGDGSDGGIDGEGIGGGVYNLGDFDIDVLDMIFANHASTDHDDIFNLLLLGSVEVDEVL